MAGSKSTQTRFIVIITFTVHPYTLQACFFDYHAPIDGDPLQLVLYP